MQIYRKNKGFMLPSYIYGKGLKNNIKRILLHVKKLEDNSKGKLDYLSHGFEYIYNGANVRVSIDPIRLFVEPYLEGGYQRTNLISSAYHSYSIFYMNYHAYKIPSHTSYYAKVAFYKPYSYLYKLKLGMYYYWKKPC